MGQVRVLIDDADIRPHGYSLGDATGGIGLVAGSHKITIRRDGVRQGSTTVALDKDQTVTLVAFAEQVPATASEPAHVAIRMFRIKQGENDNERTATFVSVSASSEVKVELSDEFGKWTTVVVKRKSLVQTPLNFSQSYAPVRVNGVVIKPIPISGKGNYVVVLYDDSDGKMKSIYYRDFKFTPVVP
jgi:hypothetical protein